MDRRITELDKDDRIKLREKFEEANKHIGFRPISKEDIDKEEQRLVKTGIYDIKNKKDKNEVRITAIKTVVLKFMRDKLKMSEDDRNKVEITKIFQSQSEDSNTIYLRCKTSNDIGIINKHAVNITQGNTQAETPSLVLHIPKDMYDRYQGCEEILYHIRNNYQGQVQTNLRIGREDFIIRCRLKTDKTKWNKIIPMKIPENVPFIKINNESEEILKPQYRETTREKVINTPKPKIPTKPPGPPTPVQVEKPNHKKDDTENLSASSQLEQMDTTNIMTSTNGSISMDLRRKGKHNITPDQSPNDKEEQPPQKMAIRSNSSQREELGNNTIQKSDSLRKIFESMAANINMKETKIYKIKTNNGTYHG